eukprot:gene9264-19227_t
MNISSSRSRYIRTLWIGSKFLSTTIISPKINFTKISVVGMGLMGHGIVQIAAQAGYSVLAIEESEVAMTSGLKRIFESLNKSIGKDKTIPDSEKPTKIAEIMSRIATTSKIEDASDSDLVIEAIAENLDLKIKFYTKLGGLVKPEAIFASNTSSLPITQMAEASRRPEKFVGLHFFNPVQIMKLVEVVRTKHTNPYVFNLMTSFANDIGKQPVSCPDTPGFIVNRLLVPYLAQ